MSQTICVPEFRVPGFRVRTRNLCLLAVTYMPVSAEVESEAFYTVEHSEWGMFVFATTFEDLLLELVEQLQMLWLEYGIESEDALSSDAIAVKRHLLRDFEAVPMLEDLDA